MILGNIFLSPNLVVFLNAYFILLAQADEITGPDAIRKRFSRSVKATAKAVISGGFFRSTNATR